MTVEEFLKRQREQGGPMALGFLMDLNELLDYYASESCATLAGKLRGHMTESNKERKQ